MDRKNIPNLSIIVNQESDFNKIPDNPQIQNMIFMNLILGIKEAQRARKKTADIVELNLTGNILSLSKENWKTALEAAESYYVGQEKYETCIVIQEIIKSIESYGSTRSYRKVTKTNKLNIKDE
jgi:hypothetical protein